MLRVDREMVTRELGELDELTMAKVLATGISRGELLEARGWLDANEELPRAAKGPTTPRVRQIVELVTEARAEEEEAELDEPA